MESIIECAISSKVLVSPEKEPGGGLWDFRWSPNGEKILAQFFGRQYLIDANSGEIESISKGSSYQTFPWSPDSEQLALAHQADGGLENSQPYILTISSGEEISLTGFDQFAKFRYFAWGFIALEP